MSLKVQLQQLEGKIAVLTDRLNQGHEWMRHLECWLLNHLGMTFPTDLTLCDGKQSSVKIESGENNADNSNDVAESQFGNLIKFRNTNRQTSSSVNKVKKSENVKMYQKKKNVQKSSTENKFATSGGSFSPTKARATAAGKSNKNAGGINSYTIIEQEVANSMTSTGLGLKVGTQIQNHEVLQNDVTSYTITPAEIVQSPANEIEIDNVKFESSEPLAEDSSQGSEATSEHTGELRTVHGDCETVVTSQGETHIHEEARYRIQEENNVLHIIKIEADSMGAGGESVISYGDALPIVQLTNVQHDSGSAFPGNMAVFSTPLGEETAIGFLNSDGSVTPCRPNVIISAGSGLSTAGTIQTYNVVTTPAPTASLPTTPTPTLKRVSDPVDPKGTFVCSICENTFQGLYLFRQHEKKSECRRIAKKLKKSEPASSPSGSGSSPSSSALSTPQSNQPSPSSFKSPTTFAPEPTIRGITATSPNLTSPVLNTPILKYKCSICGSCYASEAYLRFHLSKVHNTQKQRSPD